MQHEYGGYVSMKYSDLPAENLVELYFICKASLETIYISIRDATVQGMLLSGLACPLQFSTFM